MIVEPAQRTHGVSEYYFSAKLRQIAMMRSSGIDVINLGIGSPDLPPPEEAVNKLAAEAEKPDVHGYQSYNGIPELRKAMAGWYMKYFGVKLDPDNEILPLIGSKEGIMHISMAFINPGDEVLVPDPGYPSYSSVTKLIGGKIKTYDLIEKNNWMPDLKLLEESDLSRVKLMWVNYPNMPTGIPGSIVLFEKLVTFAYKHHILVCNDNPYSFILNRDYVSILTADSKRESVIELNSLSKSHNMAGWRIGMVAGHRDYINNILKVKSNMDSGMFKPLQLAAAEALGKDEAWYEKLNKIYRQRRKIAEEIMQILKCDYDDKQTGLFLWGRINNNFTSGEELSEYLLDNAHVFITPGFIFGKNGEKYIRISLCSNEEVLEKARKRISNVIKN